MDRRWPRSAPSRWVAKSTSTKPNTSARGCAASAFAMRPRRAGRFVRGQHLHRHGRRGRQEPADHSPAGPAKSRHSDRGDGLLRHACAGRSGRAARRGRSRDRQARAARPARPVRRGRYAHRHFAVCRPAAGVRQSAGRLHVALQLLHHSARPAASGQPAARANAGRNQPAGRRRLSRDRAHRHSPGPLWRGVEPRPAEERVDCGFRICSSAIAGGCRAISASGCRASKRRK